jgi:hypothetical protein
MTISDKLSPGPILGVVFYVSWDMQPPTGGLRPYCGVALNCSI